MQSRSPNVLLVDDDQGIVNSLVPLLRNGGFTVHKFTDPLAALEHFADKPESFNLLIADARMPGMSGIELIQKAKRLCPKLKAVLVSAFEINHISTEKLKGSEIGIDHIAIKPQSPSELVEIARRLSISD